MNAKHAAVLLLCLTPVLALNVFDRENQSISSVPNNIPPEVISVRLGTNELTEIPDDAFSHLYRLENLFVPENQLTVFPNLSSVAGTLSTLELMKNDIVYVDGILINQLEKLIRLDLSNNPINQLPDLTATLGQLQFLSIDACELTELPRIESPEKLEVIIIINLIIVLNTKLEEIEIIILLKKNIYIYIIIINLLIVLNP